METKIALFQTKEIRKTLHENEWWFVITDVVSALTDSVNPSDYLKKMRSRDAGLAEAFKGGGQIATPLAGESKGGGQLVPPLALEFDTAGGRQAIQCWNTEGIFRLIQSIPSPKAEPFKRWLAKVGYERLEEIENPELAAKRMRAIYEQKGYSEEWIEKRLRGIAVRDELTDEWNKRGVKEGKEFAILTAEISKATFGMTPAQYKEFKALSNPKENLRDHMTDLELIFTMLGEASTTEIAKKKDAQGFPQNQKAAKAGGTIAGNARKALEEKSGNQISTPENNKALIESKKRIIRKKS